eukprot:Sspe_Gene.111957::Locus_94171_Transcript_1_1_Confidence_1.000_Length_460::g.111957::m.111957/K17790/TIM22; mitochondrial import inner membrane translocase subunit TIM22
MDFEVGKTEQEMGMEMIMDSCAARSVLAAVGGYVMGAGFSVFGMMLGGAQLDNVGFKEFWRRSGRNAMRMGKGFAGFGFFFAGCELALEKRRASHDLYNPGISGGLLGGYQGYRFGGMGFGALGATAGAGF